MKKIIFLDFDGVITTEKSRYNLDKEKIELLGKILEATDAEIVISSSWRWNTVELTIKDLTTLSHRVPFAFPYCDKIIGVTIRSYHYIERKIHLSIPRGVEINQWLDTNIHSENGKDFKLLTLGKDFQYVILDDDCDMLLEQKDNFIMTDSKLGLSELDAEKAINILNKVTK